IRTTLNHKPPPSIYIAHTTKPHTHPHPHNHNMFSVFKKELTASSLAVYAKHTTGAGGAMGKGTQICSSTSKARIERWLSGVAAASVGVVDASLELERAPSCRDDGWNNAGNGNGSTNESGTGISTTTTTIGFTQPKGHLQPTVANLPRRRRATGTSTSTVPIVHVESPTPLSTPCTPEPSTMKANVFFIATSSSSSLSSSSSSSTPQSAESSSAVESSTLLTSPLTPATASERFVDTFTSTEAKGTPVKSLRSSLPLRERCGFTSFVIIGPRKPVIGWQKPRRGPQPKGHLEPTASNVPRRHKDHLIYGPM
ncbi:hypothetical protein H0H93_015114, partial [Arthromyces matolae]